jgi:hypothetical protein
MTIAMRRFPQLLLTACLALTLPVKAQYIVTFQIHQADQLSADAGAPQVVAAGTPVQLGGSPAASGGTLPYTWLWEPPANLSAPTDPNPTWIADTTQSFHLTVTDSLGCTALDSVLITIPTGIDQHGDEHRYKFSVHPNPMTGSTLTINCSTCEPGEWPVTIRNLQGQIIAETVMQTPSWQWTPNPPLPGGTLLLVTVQSEIPHHFKVIVL